MKMKNLFFGACTAFMMALAVLAIQTASSSQSTANSEVSARAATLKQRVSELEIQQREDSEEFLLIDQTMQAMEKDFELKLLELRKELLEAGVPVLPLVGDDIGIRLKSSAAGFRRTNGARFRDNANKKPTGAGKRKVTLPPGGTGW